ncbi:MAG: penicillin acylase family protein [Ardenticatenaceae bacterium]|nr:penicillin acylase family protein [Anaerolineales bacterium]MCB8920788.1 penicillin acylase family protein [Ardenticatenaceae bacterium]MCB8989747.1 penicillin acylase family protein [Ardenticatenaceae bacterium]MCB9002794.1 penicillin acylase family protein [Ardenticatenaceae bacterium]
MKVIARIGLILVSILLILAIVVAVVGTVMVRRPFPKTDGSISVPGLENEVNVYRDEYGIPHIYAENQHDLFFAQGYIHAQDRFWQMEFWRHISQGRLSEIAGDATLSSDIFIRTMGWNRMAENTIRYYEENEPEYLKVLQDYSDGVNAYIEENRDQISINQTILGLVNDPWEIEPWLPVHTVGWGVVMSDNLSGNWSDEIARAELIKELGEGQVASLLPFYPYDDRPVMVPTSAMPDLQVEEGESETAVPTPINWANVNTTLVGSKPDLSFLGSAPFVGSNNWVISGEYTASGQPLLANDPHLGIQMPSIWYEVGLHAPNFNVVGFSFAGVPGVIIGHNDHIAWGVTNVGPDVQDLYIEKLNPSDPNQYEYMGEWQDMDVIEEVVKVNGGDDVTVEVKLTRHGPIISDLKDNVQDVLSMRWTAQEPSRILQSVMLLNEAQNYDEFREALRYWDVPSQNVVYADTEGNIAYQTPSLIPIRKNGDGLVPVPGWTDEYEWEGWIPYEDLPHLFNPEWGYIVTANHAVVDEDYPYLINLYWADGDRGQRITDMLTEVIDSGRKLTADDMARIQFDSQSLMAADYQPLFAGLSSNDSQVQAALERLRGWDLQLRRDSVPAAIFEIFYYKLVDNLLADNVGADNVSDVHSRVFMHDMAQQPGAIWWDDLNTSAKETQQDIILRSLSDAIDWLGENVGKDMNDWTWGTLHTATFPSAPLGQSGIGIIEAMVNGGPIPVDGGPSIVNATSYSWGDIAAVTGHPSMRMIVDLSDFDLMQTVIPTGESGHPFNAHYEDQMPLWQNGQYHPMWFTREAVETAVQDHLILQPAE